MRRMARLSVDEAEAFFDPVEPVRMLINRDSEGRDLAPKVSHITLKPDKRLRNRADLLVRLGGGRPDFGKALWRLSAKDAELFEDNVFRSVCHTDIITYLVSATNTRYFRFPWCRRWPHSASGRTLEASQATVTRRSD